MKKPVLLIALLLACICSFARHSHTRNKSNVVYRNQYQRITCAEFSTFEIRNGRIYDWGTNNSILGIGTLTTQENSPVLMGTDSNWVSIGAGIGGNHVLAVKTDGTLWAWGLNQFGQLGIGNTTLQSSPVQVGADHDWVGVATGSFFSLALKANGTLWAWGQNSNGELGTGDTIEQHSPVQVGTDNDWVCIASGSQYSAAIKSDGSLWTWGYNEYGELGFGDQLERWMPTQVGTDDKWLSVVNNAYSAIALKADGTRWCWGENDLWELGIGDNSSHYSPVLGEPDRDWTWLASGAHGLALKDDGHLWGWGRNLEDEFGQGLPYPNYAQVPMLLNSSTYWVSAVAGINCFTFLLRADGRLWATGANSWGQLGLGYAGFQPVDTLTQSSTPATEWVSGSTGASHTAAIYSDGSLWAWGSNDHGQLGLGNTTEQHNKVQVGVGSTWTAAACGSNYTLALQANGSLWAWGLNTDGQLGTGNNSEQHSPVQVGGNWAAMAAGDAHALALKADGTLWAWGNNSTGQLGLGNYTAQNNPQQVGQDSTWIAIATGEGHSLGLKADGTLWAWGLNLYGQLGTGNNTIQDAPVQVGNDNHWTAISAGANYSMALKADGTLWAWGQNADGQLGLGNNTNFNTPQQVSQPAIVHIFTGPEADHSGILKYTRSLICLAGKNDHGQLGDGSVLDKNTFSCMNDCVIPGITITVSPNDSVCSNEALTFTATITNGGPTPGYQWFKNNVAVGSNSDTYNAGMLNNGDEIKCVLTGSAACNVYSTDTSNVITMYVTDTVTPTISIASDLGDTICQELVATYTATIGNGGPNPVYHWYENNLPVGSNSPTYVPQQVSGHTIKCVLVSSAVCASPDSVTSATHTLTILPVTIPQVTITANPGTAIAQNQSVTFTANVTNATNPQYQWKKNGSNIAGETQQTYTTTTLQNGDQIACRVRGLSACDTAISAPVTMTVWAVGVPQLSADSEQITVYPNPVTDILQVDYSNITEGQMEICDMTGRVLMRRALGHTLNMKGLASGAYLLKIKTAKQAIFVRMLLKH